MASRVPFASSFDPICETYDLLKLIGVGHSELTDKFFKIMQIEPVQPFLVDFAGSDFYDGNIPANGTTGYDTDIYKMDDELEFPNGILGQMRVVPIDDLLLKVGHDAARFLLYDTKSLTTYVSKDKPEHAVKKRQTAVDTEASFWTTTDNNEAGARIARIVKAWIQNESSSVGEVRFGDGDGTGTDANTANADMAFQVGAGESVAIGEEEIPDTKFYTGISYQVSQQPMRITLEIEEDNLYPWEDYRGSELFVWEDNVPHIQVINPQENYALEKARVMFYGFKFELEEFKGKPSRYTPVPIASMVRG